MSGEAILVVTIIGAVLLGGAGFWTWKERKSAELRKQEVDRLNESVKNTRRSVVLVWVLAAMAMAAAMVFALSGR